MKLQRSTRLVALLLIFMLLGFSCSIDETSYKNEPLNKGLSIQVIDVDGSTFTANLKESDVRSSEGMMDFSMKIDGKSNNNYSDILDSTVAEIELTNGEVLILKRDGNRIERVSESTFFKYIPIRSVEWDNEFSSIIFNYNNGETAVVYITDINTNLVKEYVGNIIVKVLGGGTCTEKYTPSLLSTNESRIAVEIAAIVIGGFVTCAIFGTLACGQTAAAGCGQGNVLNSVQICGAGMDANNEFRLGFECTYNCKK